MKYLTLFIALFVSINIKAQTSQNDTIIHIINIGNNEKVVFWGNQNTSGKYSDQLKTKEIYLYKNNKKEIIWNADIHFSTMYPDSKIPYQYCVIDKEGFLFGKTKASLVITDYLDIYMLSLKYNTHNQKWETILSHKLNVNLRDAFRGYCKLIAMDYWIFKPKRESVSIYHFVENISFTNNKDKSSLIIYQNSEIISLPPFKSN